MKQKIEQGFYEKIVGVKLYRDDIDQLLVKFKKDSMNIEISDDDNIYENLDEFATNRGNKVDELYLKVIQTSTAYFELWCLNKTVVITSPDAEMRSNCFEVKDFLLRKTVWHYKILNPWIWGTLAWATMIFWGLLSETNEKELSLKNILCRVVFWLWYFFLLLMVISWLNRRFNFQINLSRKHEAGFFNRNGDKIILLVVGSVIGAIVTLIVKLLISK